MLACSAFIKSSNPRLADEWLLPNAEKNSQIGIRYILTDFSYFLDRNFQSSW